MTSPGLEQRIRGHARELDFDDVGITPIAASEHAAFYRAWLAAGRHGTMDYLSREDAVARRLLGPDAWPNLKSAIVLAHGYVADATQLPVQDSPERGVIARYAQGRDYHKVLKQKLLRLLERIEGDVGHPLPLARAYVDTGPVLERELAQRAGLGWFGRSTMLLHPRRGSYFFLSSLLVELELEPDAPFTADHCGTCNACVAACPTGALLGRDESGAPVIDATRCISYLTIEQRGPIPQALRPLVGNRVFGCDICQEVCPWNSPKIVQATNEPGYLSRARALRGTDPSGTEPHSATSSAPGTGRHPHAHAGPATDSPSLVELMRMSREAWDVWTRGSAIRRAGYTGFKRNVAVAIGNWLASMHEPPEEAVAALRDALGDDSELVREHAAWALGRQE